MNESKITTLYFDGNGGSSSEATPSAPWVWHHIKYNDKAAVKWIKNQPELSQFAKITLINSETRPRVHVEDDELIMCLRGINLNEEADPEDMISIRLWVGPQTIITSSNAGSQSIRNIRALLTEKVGPKNAEEFVATLIDQLANLTDEFVEKLDQKLDDTEDHIENLSHNEFNPQINQMRRQIAHIRRYLLPQKEALDKLYRQKSSRFTEPFYDQIYVEMDKFMQMIESLDLMRERALMLQEHFMANVSHQQNSRLYLLAIISAIFLPLTFLSGLFGMNVAGMPGLENNLAFTYVITFSVILTVLLLVWFKKSKWF
jgi:zinc transporter